MKRKNNKEQGSITLFTIISIIFFLIISVGIYINISNKSGTQVSEISKIKSEYEISKEQMDEKYEEVVNNINNKVIITMKKESDDSEYVSGVWTNDAVKVTIEFPDYVPDDEKIIYINGKEIKYEEEIIIDETTTIKVNFNGKEQNAQINIDKVLPKVTIAADKTSPTNASSIKYTFTFSEEVTDFTADDIQVTNGTKGEFAGSGKTYTLVVTNNGSTTQTVKVDANKCTDKAGNGNLESNTVTMTIDKVAPTVNITADKTSPTNANSIKYTITFSEEVTGFTADDIQVTNGTKGEFTGSGKTYTLVVTNAGSTTQTVKVDANKCTDKAGNGNTASNTFTMNVDRTAPTVNITADKTTPTNANSIKYTFTFSEEVTGFTADDIQVTNGTKGEFTGSGKTYTLVVTNTGTTTQTVKVDANKCTDAAGNVNAASNTVTITVDRTAPTVNITADKTSPTNASSITYTFTFSEDVTGFTTDDITVTNGTKGTFSGSGKTYTLVVTNTGTTTQTVKVDANKCTDAAGNVNAASNTVTITVDRTAPTVNITADKTSPTNASSITYTFTFSEDVTGFTADDIQVTNGTKGTFSGSGKTYTLVVTNTGTTTQTVKVDANKCTDAAGNVNAASNTVTMTIDRTAPTVSITANKTSPTNASSITYTFTFSEEVTGFTADDITVTNGAKGTFSGSGKTYTLVVTQSSSTTQTVKVDANKCTDKAGNANTASNAVTITIDTVPPSIYKYVTSEKTGMISIYGEDDLSGIAYIEDSTGNRYTPKNKDDIKILVIENNKDDADSLNAGIIPILKEQYKNVDYNTSITYNQILASDYDVIISNKTAWETAKADMINKLFAAGKTILTTGNDNGSSLDIIKSHTQGSTGYTANRKVVNEITNKIGETIVASNDSLKHVQASDKAEVWYSYTSGGVEYDAMMYMENEQGGKWFHSQLNPSTSELFRNIINVITRLANINGMSQKITQDGTYTYKIVDKAGNVATSSVQVILKNTLTINPNGGTYNNSTSKTTVTQTHNTKYTLSNPTPPAKYTVTYSGEGGSVGASSAISQKTFLNWTLTGGGSLSGNIYTFGTSDGTVTANYSDGSVTLTTATRNGHTFLGWYDQNGNKVGDAGSKYIPKSNITLYAHWKSNVVMTSISTSRQYIGVNGSTTTAQITVQGSNLGTVTYKSSNTGLATVDSNGKVTAVKAGTVTITATSSWDTSVYKQITIYVTSLTASGGAVTVLEDATITLAAPITGGNVGTITYTSSNTSYATVNNSRVVKGIDIGTSVSKTVTITVKESNGGATCTYTVYVRVWATGDGTSGNPYRITNTRDITKLQKKVNSSTASNYRYGGTYFLQTTSIAISSWTPIGNASNKRFNGIYNGNGKTITGISIDTLSYNAGLFGSLGGTLQNLNLTGTVKGSYSCGAIVGEIYEGAQVTKCNNRANVTAQNTVGGIVGAIYGGTVTQCANNGTITLQDRGISGDWMANVVSSGGGICGVNCGTISQSYNKGNLVMTRNNTSSEYMVLGGIVGYDGNTVGSSGSIVDCFNKGNISGYGDYFGGVAGNTFNGTITNAYNVGSVSSTKSSNSTTGGVTGALKNVSTIKNAYSLDTSCVRLYYLFDWNAYVGGMYSRTAAQIKSLAGTLGGNWKADSSNVNSGYPILKWM